MADLVRQCMEHIPARRPSAEQVDCRFPDSVIHGQCAFLLELECIDTTCLHAGLKKIWKHIRWCAPCS